MSRIMRKPDFCICENKGADQLCSNCTADHQRLCFRLRILLVFSCSVAYTVFAMERAQSKKSHILAAREYKNRDYFHHFILHWHRQKIQSQLSYLQRYNVYRRNIEPVFAVYRR